MADWKRLGDTMNKAMYDEAMALGADYFVGRFVYEAALRIPGQPSLEIRQARQLLGQSLFFPNARITYGQ